MAPALRPGDRLLVDRSAYRNEDPVIGDVVVFPDPSESSRWLVKRVVGIGPGRFVKTREGLGRSVPTPSETSPPPESVEMVTVPSHTVFVCGDALGHSRDSRDFGPIPIPALIGRAFRRYAPASRRGDL